MARAKIGIIGGGNIAETYLRHGNLFSNIEIVAIADIVPAVAKARAEQFSIRAMTVDGLLKDDGIDAVVNLTVPNAHFQVSHEILSAGKHAYSEKPLSLTRDEANRLVKEADRRGLKLGGAPDTFLGGGAQTVRRLLDKGTIGTVVAATAHVMSHGMENWHPNPAFFFKPGGGPIFDIGPYYITTLVSLLGPVRRVAAMAKKGFAERIVGSAARRGERIKVTTPTTINAVLEFDQGAQATLGTSWDVWRHGHPNPIELYGTDGSMLVPDPNFFGGTISYSDKGGELRDHRHIRRTLRRSQPALPAGRTDARQLPPARRCRSHRRGQPQSRAALLGAACRACGRRHGVDPRLGTRPALRQHPLHGRAAGPVDFGRRPPPHAQGCVIPLARVRGLRLRKP